MSLGKLSAVEPDKEKLSEKDLQDIFNASFSVEKDQKIFELSEKNQELMLNPATGIYLIDRLIQYLEQNDDLNSVKLKSGSESGHELSDELYIDAVKRLIDVIKAKKNLKILGLEGLNLGNRLCVYLADLLSHNRNIEFLYITYNNIDRSGCEILAEELGGNSQLLILSIANNKIGDAGFGILCTKLVENKTLRYLNVSTNLIGASGGIHAAKLLNHTELRILNLDHNKLGHQGYENFAIGFIERNPDLEELSLRDTSLDAAGCASLHNIIKLCPNLAALDLHENNFNLHDLKIESLDKAHLKKLTVEVDESVREMLDRELEEYSSDSSSLGSSALDLYLDSDEDYPPSKRIKGAEITPPLRPRSFSLP